MEKLYDNFVELCRIHNVPVNIKKGNFATTLESVINSITDMKNCLNKPEVNYAAYQFNIGMNDMMDLIELILNIHPILNTDANKFLYISNFIGIQRKIIDKHNELENDIRGESEHYSGIKAACDIINGLLDVFKTIDMIPATLSHSDKSWEIGVIRDYITKRKDCINGFIGGVFLKAQMDILLIIELILNDE